MTARLWPVVVVVTCVALAGCGSEVATTSPTPAATTTPPAAATTTPPGPDQRYTITALVLESPEHGPQICIGGMDLSYPPQCGTIDVVGWDWAAVEGEESRSGTTWGTYTVVGTYDGVRLTLTEPARTPGPGDDIPSDPIFGASSRETPCDPPPGGWQQMPYETALEDSVPADLYAMAQPDFAAAWMDMPGPEIWREADTDPMALVLNYRFTGDLDRHEAALRALWDGSLCVTKAERSQDEVHEIRDEIAAWDGLVSVNSDDTIGKISVFAIVDNANLQQRLDERYGSELATVAFALTPVPAEHS
jgi:hypothetical protein